MSVSEQRHLKNYFVNSKEGKETGKGDPAKMGQTGASKMVDLNPTPSIITLQVSCLNIKKHIPTPDVKNKQVNSTRMGKDTVREHQEKESCII